MPHDGPVRAVTPYNDHKVGTTYLAGHRFPVGAIFRPVPARLGL